MRPPLSKRMLSQFLPTHSLEWGQTVQQRDPPLHIFTWKQMGNTILQQHGASMPGSGWAQPLWAILGVAEHCPSGSSYYPQRPLPCWFLKVPAPQILFI